MDHLSDWTRPLGKKLDQALSTYLSDQHTSKTLQKAMNYSLSAGGKRIRPMLGFATAKALREDIDLMMPVACAIEMIHTYSLIHDDLPAMDDDDLRRGKATNHKVFGEACAILAGDALLTLAFSILSQASWNIQSEKKLAIISHLSQASGAKGMVAGQVLDMESENQSLNEIQLETIHRNKTAQLLSASVMCAALCFDPTPEQYAALEVYGRELGLAFQIADDILDETASTEELGKPSGSDQKKHKSTYPSVFGLETSKQKAQQCLEKALTAIDIFQENAQQLRALASYIIERKK
ncbi:MAG: polyprenyl synthetase family protein [Bdellovibrionales bacterium]|nr:polyprenyl synthetase family protein [Bdellovibrionales bacterium]